MSASVYARLPSKFDFRAYYLNQAAGGPSFPIYRARQHGGSFLSPLIKRHGIPFLRWLGRQAASVATGIGSTYLDKGSLNKDDVKGILKTQGKKAATSALDKLKQQVGAGSTMNFRRDGRLSALIPTTTRRKEGVITPFHGVRPPSGSELAHSLGSPIDLTHAHRRVGKRKKGPGRRKGSSKKRKGAAGKSKNNTSTKSPVKTKRGRKAKDPKRKTTKKKKKGLNPG